MLAAASQFFLDLFSQETETDAILLAGFDDKVVDDFVDDLYELGDLDDLDDRKYSDVLNAFQIIPKTGYRNKLLTTEFELKEEEIDANDYVLQSASLLPEDLNSMSKIRKRGRPKKLSLIHI